MTASERISHEIASLPTANVRQVANAPGALTVARDLARKELERREREDLFFADAVAWRGSV